MNIERLGNFTSSKIAALMSNGKAAGTMGKPAFTYIRSRKREILLGRRLDTDSAARPTSWGNLCEKRAFDLLGLDYILSSKETIKHPTIGNWMGSPDGIKEVDGIKTVFDVKCPYTLNSFCDFYDCLGDINAVRLEHEDGEKYYWQIVSNAILTGATLGELIIYCPYLSELQTIKDMAMDMPQEESYKYFWVANANNNELPYLIDGGHYKNINIIRFEIPQEDKDALTERVEAALKILNT